MDSSANIAIAVLLVAVVVLAGLVYLFGYPLLIWVAVIAAFSALAFIVVLSVGDFGSKPSRPSAQADSKIRSTAAKA